MSAELETLRKKVAAAQAACVAITYVCGSCGEFEVIKNRADLAQRCSCGLLATPTAIAYVGIKTDGKWVSYRLPSTPEGERS